MATIFGDVSSLFRRILDERRRALPWTAPSMLAVRRHARIVPV